MAEGSSRKEGRVKHAWRWLLGILHVRCPHSRLTWPISREIGKAGGAIHQVCLDCGGSVEPKVDLSGSARWYRRKPVRKRQPAVVKEFRKVGS